MASSKKINVLHIDTGLHWRGGQRQVLTLHEGLIKKNIKSHLTCNLEGELFKKQFEKNISNLTGFKFDSEFSALTIKLILEKIELLKPNIIHCHDSHSVGLIRTLKHQTNATLFHTRRVSYPINFLSRFIKYNKIDVHIAVSDNINKYLSNFFQNIHTIQSCIDSSRFAKKNKKVYVFDQFEKNILFVGALTNQKGVHTLLEAFSRVSSNHNIGLHIVGDGVLKNELRKFVLAKKIHEKVIFHGSKMNVEDFYISADYVVSPSIDGEGSNGVIKEALAAGKTVIASNLEDNKDLFEDNETGFFFEKNNPSSLQEILTKLIDSKIYLNSENLKKHAKKFNCKNLILEHLKLYDKYS